MHIVLIESSDCSGRELGRIVRLRERIQRGRVRFSVFLGALELVGRLNLLIHSSLPPGSRRQVLPRCHIRLR